LLLLFLTQNLKGAAWVAATKGFASWISRITRIKKGTFNAKSQSYKVAKMEKSLGEFVAEMSQK
jgi:hypothetical protein